MKDTTHTNPPNTTTTTMAACASCGALIFWLKNVTTGKLAPINAEVSAEGNIACFTNGTYTVVPKAMRAEAQYAGKLHTNHFSDCPQAPVWHRHGSTHRGHWHQRDSKDGAK